MPALDAGEEADPAGEDEDGGAGYLGRFETLSLPMGLCGLNILSGPTVGLSQSSAGRGRLIKSSSSGTSRDREPMVDGISVLLPWLWLKLRRVCARGLECREIRRVGSILATSLALESSLLRFLGWCHSDSGRRQPLLESDPCMKRVGEGAVVGGGVEVS